MYGESSLGQLGREEGGQVVGGVGEEAGGVGRGGDGYVGWVSNNSFRTSIPRGNRASYGQESWSKTSLSFTLE